MVRELEFVPRFARARRADFATLLHVSFFMFLIQLSVVLATSVDTAILGFALPRPGGGDGGIQRRQQAVHAGPPDRLDAGVPGDAGRREPGRGARPEGLERVKYDGPRLHIGMILPVGLLAWIYAAPFLQLWVGAAFGPGKIPELAGLLRLFLIAAIPLVPVGPRADGHRHGEDRGRRHLGPGRRADQPADQLLPDPAARDVRGRDLGDGADDPLLQRPGPRRSYVFRILEVRASTFLARTLAAPWPADWPWWRPAGPCDWPGRRCRRAPPWFRGRSRSWCNSQSAAWRTLRATSPSPPGGRTPSPCWPGPDAPPRRRPRAYTDPGPDRRRTWRPRATAKPAQTRPGRCASTPARGESAPRVRRRAGGSSWPRPSSWPWAGAACTSSSETGGHATACWPPTASPTSPRRSSPWPRGFPPASSPESGKRRWSRPAACSPT